MRLSMHTQTCILTAGSVGRPRSNEDSDSNSDEGPAEPAGRAGSRKWGVRRGNLGVGSGDEEVERRASRLGRGKVSRLRVKSRSQESDRRKQEATRSSQCVQWVVREWSESQKR